jgi:putative GTP pyrophosphokinase
MTWQKPQYSKSQVRKAGQRLLNSNTTSEDFLESLQIIENWRSCHGYPINTFQATLRSKLKTIDSSALVSQRLKRMQSILNKLQRFPSMNLDRMQDFGGLRAVVSSVEKLRLLENNYRQSHFKHDLVSCKDYVDNPKSSGYRSIHFVYRYSNPIAPEYDGLFVELQMRTKLQHAWATAVETMGTFLDQALKSSEGHDVWLNYFSLCSAAFASLEKTPVHETYKSFSADKLYKMLVFMNASLKVVDKLKGFSVAAQNIHLKNRRGAYHIIALKFKERRVSIQSFGKRSLEAASERYAELELEITNGAAMHVVLVSAGSLKNLRKAYPSYFLDARKFITYLNVIERLHRKGEPA